MGRKSLHVVLPIDSDLAFLRHVKSPGKVVAFVIKEYFKDFSDEQKYLKAVEIVAGLARDKRGKAKGTKQSAKFLSLSEKELGSKPDHKPEKRSGLSGIPRDFYKSG